MKLWEMSPRDREEAEARAAKRIAQMGPGDEFRIRFTSRGTRQARCTRIGAKGQRFIQAYSPKTRTWTKERPVTPDDLIL